MGERASSPPQTRRSRRGPLRHYQRFFPRPHWLVAIQAATATALRQRGRSEKRSTLMWQHRTSTLSLLVMVSFCPVLQAHPGTAGSARSEAFLISGVARVVVMQHGTFLINSACHTLGRRPYSTRCSARDSFLDARHPPLRRRLPQLSPRISARLSQRSETVALGPTKWMIWLLSKIGLTGGLRRAQPAKRFKLRKRKFAAPAPPKVNPS